MQSHAYCLSALYEGVDAISTKDGMVNEAVSEHTHILPYSPIALIQLLNLCSSPTWWLWRSGCTDPIPNSAVKRSSANGTLS